VHILIYFTYILQVQRLAEDKKNLQESLTEVVHEKDIVHTEHETNVHKMSVLEHELLTLKQQVIDNY